MIDFLQGHGVETVVEDHGRVLLKSGKAKELLELLTHSAHENDVEISLSQNVLKIQHLPDGQFSIMTEDKEYHAKKLIIAS